MCPKPGDRRAACSGVPCSRSERCRVNRAQTLLEPISTHFRRYPSSGPWSNASSDNSNEAVPDLSRFQSRSRRRFAPGQRDMNLEFYGGYYKKNEMTYGLLAKSRRLLIVSKIIRRNLKISSKTYFFFDKSLRWPSS